MDKERSSTWNWSVSQEQNVMIYFVERIKGLILEFLQNGPHCNLNVDALVGGYVFRENNRVEFIPRGKRYVSAIEIKFSTRLINKYDTRVETRI